MKIIYAETNALNKYKSERFFKQIKKCLKKVDAFVFQTDVEREELSVTQSYYVINNPVKPGLPQPYVGTRDKKIVNFCRLSRQKNLLLLIQAFEKLLKFFPDYKLEIFADLCTPQSQEYKNSVLGNDYNKRIFVEMLSSFGLHKYAANTMTIDHFGASANYADLQKFYDYTPERLTKTIKSLLKGE